MQDYQKMYFILFNRVTDTIEHLRQAQAETEEQYLRSTATDLHLLQPDSESSAKK